MVVESGHVDVWIELRREQKRSFKVCELAQGCWKWKGETMIKRGKQEAKFYCISAWPLGTLKAETKAAKCQSLRNKGRTQGSGTPRTGWSSISQSLFKKGKTEDSGSCYNLSVLGKQLTAIAQIPSDEHITEVQLLTGPKIDCVSTMTKSSPLVLSAKLEFQTQTYTITPICSLTSFS